MEERQKRKKRMIYIIVPILLVLIGLVTILVIQKIIPSMERSKNMKVYRQEGYIEQDVTKYLEERYGEEFVIESIHGRNYARDFINMYAYPKDHQEESYQFKIQGRYNEKGILEYTDSYVMIKLRDDYEAYVAPIIDEYFDEYKFYMNFDSEWITSNIPADATLEDLWELDANVDYPLPSIYLYLSNSENENYNDKIIGELSEQLQGKNFRGYMQVVMYGDDTYYDKRFRETINVNIGAPSEEVKLSVIFIYDDKIDISNR